jgi:CRP-like cAMP-binding protein
VAARAYLKGIALIRLSHHPLLDNRILADLPHAEADILRSHLRHVRLVSDQILVERGHTAEHVYFVEEGIVSLVAEPHETRAGVQVAMIGKESLVGADALLDAGRETLAAAVVQIPGWAVRLPSQDLCDLLDTCPELRRRCLSAISALFQQIVQISASNACSSLAERCARWLLMAHERVGYGDIYITHEALSSGLGVRRSGISGVLAALQEAGLITVHRGRIVVRDRDGLARSMANRMRGENGVSSVSRRFSDHTATGRSALHCNENLT